MTADPIPSRLRTRLLAPTLAALVLVSLTGCGGGSRSLDDDEETETAEDAALPAMTPKQVVAGKWPDGFQLGDPVSGIVWRPVDHSRSERIEGAFERTHRRSGPTLYRLRAAGIGRIGKEGGTDDQSAEAQVVQAIYPDPGQLPLNEFAAQAGITPGPAVGMMQIPYYRDGERMSSSSTAIMREPAVVIGTDRKGVYLVLRGEKVDSVLHASDLEAIRALEGTTIAAESAKVAAALAAGKPDDIDTVVWTRAGRLPHGEAIAAAWQSHEAAYAAVLQRRYEETKAHDAPIHAAIDAKLAVLRSELDAAPDAAWLTTWCAGIDAIAVDVRRLRGTSKALADARALLAAEAASRDLHAATIDGLLWSCVVGPLAEASTADLRAVDAAATALAAAQTYAAGQDAWSAFSKVVDRLHLEQVSRLDENGNVSQERHAERRAVEQRRERRAHPHLSAAATREAAAMRAAGRVAAAAWLDHVAADLLRAYTINDRAWRPSASTVTDLATQLDALPAGIDDRAAMVAAIADRLPMQSQDNVFSRGYLSTLVRAMADEQDREAAALQADGWFATAAVRRMQALALRSDSWSPVVHLDDLRRGTAGESGRAVMLRELLPLIEELWPAPDATTAHAPRLAELLVEGARLDWPLVRIGLLVPGSPPVAEAAAGDAEPAEAPTTVSSPAGYLHAIDDGGALRLERRPQAQILAGGTDWVHFYANLGVSAETRTEGAELRKIQEQIDKDKAEQKPEIEAIEARGKRLDEEKPRMEQLQRKAAAGDEAARLEFNRLVEHRNAEVRTQNAAIEALKRKQVGSSARVEAYNQRVQPYNERLNRERSAARAASDLKLEAALTAWFTERLASREQRLRAEHPAGDALETEIRLGRWLVGAGTGPTIAVASNAHAKLHCAAIERRVPVTASYEERMDLVLAWWRWSAQAGHGQAVRENTASAWVGRFAREASAALVRKKITGAGLPANEAARFESWVKAAEEAMKK